MAPERLALYLTSALLVGCIMIGWVRSGTWKVFFVSAPIGVIVYGIVRGRLVGVDDHPLTTAGPLIYLVLMSGLGAILGFLWTLVSPILIKVMPKFRSAPTDDMSNPQEIVLDLLYGRWRTQTLFAGVKLGIFEVVEGEPMPADKVAHELNLDPALSYRLLRALASLGLLNENRERCFSITEAGKVLRSDHPQSLRDMILLREGPEHTAIWQHLPAMVRDGKQDGFVREFGRTAFDYAMVEPTYAAAFDAGMSSHSRLQTAWVLEALRSHDFASMAHLCDIGGGQGHLLCHILAKYPHLAGTVLELASVLENAPALWAGKLGVGDRCRYLAGDMFADVPPADAYIMKMILHDWNDEECVRILKNVKRRAPAGGRIFIVEHVIREIDTKNFGTMFDIHMMCWGTGRERTEREYANLLQAAGWNYVASWFPRSGIIGVIEGASGI